MGNSASSGSGDQAIEYPPQESARPKTNHVKKRAIDHVYDTNDEATPEPVRRKKLRRTSEYIYDALFVNGENSDITIRSLGREWKLHKVYLRQANYFKSMYHNQWKETSMQVIDLQIPDNNIDVNALNITFGSLYSEDVLISPSEVVSILAAASLIQLEGLMQQCAEVMKETISQWNVITYLKTASLYGQTDVCEQCMSWLEMNLMIKQCQDLLREIDPELLTDIIQSPNLVVIQIEMDIYTMLKKWLFLHLNLSYSGDLKEIILAADAYFDKEAKLTNAFFLDSEQGKRYAVVFKALRLQHVIRDFVSCREIERDRIIPWSWLSLHYREQWLSMLRIEQNMETGPRQLLTEEFEANCLRCGRLLLRDTDHCWRWNGYNFGLDLLVSYSTQGPRTITFKRNVRAQRCSSSVSLASTRHFIFKVTVASVDEKGHTVHRKSTGNTTLYLQKEQEQVVLTLNNWESAPGQQTVDSNWKSNFPLIVSATFQVVNNLQTPELTQSGHSIMPFPPTKDDAQTLGDEFSVHDDEDV